jgi:endonuclease III
MNENAIRDKLVEHGQTLFSAPKQLIQFTTVPAADALLNDLTNHPHAFVLACVMDRQIKAERAWLIPYRISEKLGGFTMQALCQLKREDVSRLMSQPEPLHRFGDMMSGFFHSAVQRITAGYFGDAARIWTGNLTSAEVVYRFLEFDGVGPKIASMAANILAREFKIPFADYFSIDISADVHVRRVFSRLGLCRADASVEQVIYKARALHPEFPGMMDLPCWEIGRNWCKARDPECGGCYMRDMCSTARRMKSAKPSDWKTEALTSKRTSILLNRAFSAQEMRRIRMGLVPGEMEDKWFIYWKDDTLFFHRSWTGFCVYVVRFVADGDSHKMIEADVNRDPEQYAETNDDLDARMISYLIDLLLLQRETDYPSDEPSAEKRILKQWSQVGRAMFGDHLENR